MPYVSASEVMIHEKALYQVYVLLAYLYCEKIVITRRPNAYTTTLGYQC